MLQTQKDSSTFSIPSEQQRFAKELKQEEKYYYCTCFCYIHPEISKTKKKRKKLRKEAELREWNK